MGALGRSRPGRPLVESAVKRAFSPGTPPPEYLRIAPALALEPGDLLSDGGDRKTAEEGLAALRPLYPGLLVPLVIVVGEQDRMVPPALSERLTRSCRHRSSCACPAPATCPSSRRRTPSSPPSTGRPNAPATHPRLLFPVLQRLRLAQIVFDLLFQLRLRHHLSSDGLGSGI